MRKAVVPWLLLLMLAGPPGWAQGPIHLRNDSDGVWYLQPQTGSCQVSLRSGPNRAALGQARTVQVVPGSGPLAVPPHQVLVLDSVTPGQPSVDLYFSVRDGRQNNPDGVILHWRFREGGSPLQLLGQSGQTLNLPDPSTLVFTQAGYPEPPPPVMAGSSLPAEQSSLVIANFDAVPHRFTLAGATVPFHTGFSRLEGPSSENYGTLKPGEARPVLLEPKSQVVCIPLVPLGGPPVAFELRTEELSSTPARTFRWTLAPDPEAPGHYRAALAPLEALPFQWDRVRCRITFQPGGRSFTPQGELPPGKASFQIKNFDGAAQDLTLTQGTVPFYLSVGPFNDPKAAKTAQLDPGGSATVRLEPHSILFAIPMARYGVPELALQVSMASPARHFRWSLTPDLEAPGEFRASLLSLDGKALTGLPFTWLPGRSLITFRSVPPPQALTSVPPPSDDSPSRFLKDDSPEGKTAPTVSAQADPETPLKKRALERDFDEPSPDGPEGKRLKTAGAIEPTLPPSPPQVEAPVLSLQALRARILAGQDPGLVVANRTAFPAALRLLPAHPGLVIHLLHADGGSGAPLTLPTHTPATLELAAQAQAILAAPTLLDAFAATLACTGHGPDGAAVETTVEAGRLGTEDHHVPFLKVVQPNGDRLGPERLPAGLHWDEGAGLELR